MFTCHHVAHLAIIYLYVSIYRYETINVPKEKFLLKTDPF